MVSSLREENKDLRCDLKVASSAAKQMATESASAEKTKWKDRLRVHQLASSKAVSKKEHKYKQQLSNKSKEIKDVQSKSFH